VPLLYAALLAIGAIEEPELLTFRQPGSRLGGHPVPGIPFVDVATGPLGVGLAIGSGMALAMQRLEPRSSRIWVVCGDGELAEGGGIVVVEDHRPEGGLGSAVAEALATRGQSLRLAHLAVRGMPGSASPEEQRAAAGIDAAAIAAAVRRLAAGEAGPDAPLQASPAERGDDL